MAKSGIRPHLVAATALASTLAAWLVFPLPLRAEEPGFNEVDADKGDQLTLLNRIVIGAGAEKVAIDTPQAVTVIEGDDLDGLQAETIGDLIRTVPGVHAAGSESLLGQSVNIRGIGAPESASDQNRIRITIDGVAKFYESYRMGGIFLEPDLTKRVEVLRGPASATLHGAGLIGGVIAMTTRDPADFLADGKDVGGRIATGWMSKGDGLNASAILAARASDSQEMMIAVSGRRQGIWHDGDGNDVGASALAAGTVLAKSVTRFGDAGEQSLTMSYQDWLSAVDDQTFAQTSATSSFGTVDRVVRDRTLIAAWDNPASDNDWIDLKARLSWSRTTNSQSDARQPSGEPWDPDLVPLFQDAVYGYETWALDLSNTIDASGETWENHLTAGLQLTHQTRSVEALRQLDFHPGGEDAKIGVYLQNEFVFADSLTLIPGLRIDHRRLSPGAGLDGLPSQTDTAISPKLAAHYRLNDTIALFGSLSRTERLPSLDEVYSAWYPGYPVDFTPAYGLGLKTEQAFTREIGLSLTTDGLVSEDDTASLKITGFSNRIRDLIQRNGFGANSGFENIGRARIDGLEIEMAYESERLFAQAGYSLVRGRDLSSGGWLNTVAPDELGLVVGSRLPDRDIAFGWRGRFVAAQNRVATGDTARLPTPGTAVHGLFVDWTPKEGALAGLTARLAVDNLFDRSYRDFLANDPAPGRTVKIVLSQSF